MNMLAENQNQSPFTCFLQSLFETGDAILSKDISSVSEIDLQSGTELLYSVYRLESIHIPVESPDFSEPAAIWAALYLYRAAQLTLLREVEEQDVVKLLQPFAGEKTPAEHFSADLTLRHLFRLHQLAAGLSPGDILVRCINETAESWPLSGVGIITETTPGPGALSTHPGMLIYYTDRVIAMNDKARASHDDMKEHIKEALGIHAHEIWPGLDTDLLNTTVTLTDGTHTEQSA